MRPPNILLTVIALASLTSCTAQIKNTRTSTVRINGDCDMCKVTIEKAGSMKGEAQVVWDTDAKTAVVTYDSTRTDLDAVLQRVAHAGYDNERYLAPTEAYAKLPGCCQYERTDKHASVVKEADAHAAHAHHGTEAEPAAAPTSQAEAHLKPVFDAYFALKNALVASDGALARKKGSAFDEAVHGLPMEKLSPEVHTVWMEVMPALMPPANIIADTDDLEKQRKAFAQLAAPMVQLSKAAPGDGTMYLDHCPMYNGGADWLSQEKGIKNPFYGSQMLTCGSVKETIE